LILVYQRVKIRFFLLSRKNSISFLVVALSEFYRKAIKLVASLSIYKAFKFKIWRNDGLKNHRQVAYLFSEKRT